MSKRSTTGAPKASQRRALEQKRREEAEERRKLPQYLGGGQVPRLVRETHTRSEREAEIQRLSSFGPAILSAVAIVILVAAVLIDQLIVPGQAVASVNNETITVDEFRRRVRLERALLNQQLNEGIQLFAGFGFDSDQIIQQLSSQPPYSTWLNEMQVADQLGNRVLNEMVEDQLIRDEVAARGIVITDDDVQRQINAFFGYDPEALLTEPTATPTPTVTPTPFVSPTPSPMPTETPLPALTPTPSVTPLPSATPSPTPNATEQAETFATNRDAFYAAIRSRAGVSDEDINRYFESEAYREALRDAVTAEMTRTAPFVNARHILIETTETADDVLAALEAGEPFASLARSVSTDTQSAEIGGELGWGSPDGFVDEFAEAVRTAEIGDIVGPIQTEFGQHVIQVRAREDREMTDTEFEAAQEREFEEFVTALRRETLDLELFDTWVDNVPEEPRLTLSGL
ncbi:MAG: hypothetical protein GYB67_13010 [Chloroflexi bacterium]|nr:hypothetical protein [Chloroflexota bacterium]